MQITNEAFLGVVKHVEMKGHWGAKFLTEKVLKTKSSRPKFLAEFNTSFDGSGFRIRYHNGQFKIKFPEHAAGKSP